MPNKSFYDFAPIKVDGTAKLMAQVGFRPSPNPPVDVVVPHGLALDSGEFVPAHVLNVPPATTQQAIDSRPAPGQPLVPVSEKHVSISDTTGNRKDDTGKLRWGLLLGGAGIAVKAIVEILEIGARKYNANGWQNVPGGYERYKDALYRHLHAVEVGGPGSVDEESGKLDLAHAGCNIVFMIWYQLTGKA